MNKKNSTILIIAVVAIAIFIAGSNTFAIYTENIYTDGKVLNYFDRANPVQIKISVAEPDQQPYDDVRFHVTTSFSTVRTGATKIATSEPYVCPADYCYWRSCQGCDATCQTAGEYCWNFGVPVVSNYISCSIDGIEVFRKNSDGTQTIGANDQTTNIALIVNTYLPSVNSPVKTMFMSCAADKNSGSVFLSSSPSVEIKSPILPPVPYDRNETPSPVINNNTPIPQPEPQPEPQPMPFYEGNTFYILIALLFIGIFAVTFGIGKKTSRHHAS